MSQEQLFASFMLDKELDLEIALKAEHVSEATAIQGTIRRLPGSVPYLEGIMHLRDDVIPVINLKHRLGLDRSQYGADAKVAVVSLQNQRFGLLFDDIREVFRAESKLIMPISKVLQSEDRVVSSLIKLDGGHRSVELLDLQHLFDGDLADLSVPTDDSQAAARSGPPVTYTRYVIFSCAGQQYGIPVQCAQEITFCTDIDEMFRTGIIEGALELRGNTIPVLSARSLLVEGAAAASGPVEDSRILVLSDDSCTIGIVVDEVRDILTIGSDRIMPFPNGKDKNVQGLFCRSTGENVILLDMHNLVCGQIDAVKSMARLGNGSTKADAQKSKDSGNRTTHHLITENCYLVFSIGKHFAIELKDVREIIEHATVMHVPGTTGYSTGVINLRGEVVPVVNLRRFFNYQKRSDDLLGKLIICTGNGHTVALEVDQIVTIYKQEQYHATPSLNPQLSERKDTLDRLIEYFDTNGIKEHVLVVNTRNLIRNHLQPDPDQE